MAERFIPIRLALTTDDRQFRQAFAKLDQEGAKAAASLGREFAKSGNGIAGAYRDANGRLRDEFGKFVSTGKKAFDEVGGYTRDSAGRMRDQFGRFVGAGKKGFEDFERAGEKTALSLREKFSKIGDGMKSVGRTLSAALTLPLVGIGTQVTRIGVQYEQAMNILQATTKATSAEMAKAATVARQLGADNTLAKTSALNAAQAMNELAKGGLTVQQAMDAARGTLQLATAAGIAEAQAAEIAANALNAFSLKASESTRVADLLAASANASSADITDVAAALQQSSAAAAALNIPLEDAVTAIGLMANAGIKGSDAGTSLKTAFLALAAPTKKAAGEMDALGINAFDASGKLLPMREIVSKVSEVFGKLTDQQKVQAAETIFGTDAMRAALTVFGAGGEKFDTMSAAVKRSGACHWVR